MLIIMFSSRCFAEPKFKVNTEKGVRVVTNQNREATPDFKCGVKLVASLNKEKIEKYKLLDILQEVGAKYIKNVKTDSRNNFYFLGANKVIKLNSNLEFLTQWGKIGPGPGEFKGAYDLFIFQDTVYVNDQNRFQILKFDQDGKYLAKKFTDINSDLSCHYFHGIISTQKNGFIAPVSNCYRYELDGQKSFYKEQIALFNSYLKKTKVLFERQIVKTDKDWPFFIAAASKKEFAVVENDYDAYKINVYDINSGKLTTKIRRSFKKIKNPETGVTYSSAQTQKGELRIKDRPAEFLEPIVKIFYDQNNRLWVQARDEKWQGEVVFDIYMNGILMKKLAIPWDKDYLEVKMFGNKLLLMDALTLETSLYEIY